MCTYMCIYIYIYIHKHTLILYYSLADYITLHHITVRNIML